MTFAFSNGVEGDFLDFLDGVGNLPATSGNTPHLALFTDQASISELESNSLTNECSGYSSRPQITWTFQASFGNHSVGYANDGDLDASFDTSDYVQYVAVVNDSTPGEGTISMWAELPDDGTSVGAGQTFTIPHLDLRVYSGENDLSDYVQDKFIKYATFQLSSQISAPSPYYALFGADPGDSGVSNECTASGYSRQSASLSGGTQQNSRLTAAENNTITFDLNELYTASYLGLVDGSTAGSGTQLAVTEFTETTDSFNNITLGTSPPQIRLAIG